jgi:hypothetical protein
LSFLNTIQYIVLIIHEVFAGIKIRLETGETGSQLAGSKMDFLFLILNFYHGLHSLAMEGRFAFGTNKGSPRG